MLGAGGKAWLRAALEELAVAKAPAPVRAALIRQLRFDQLPVGAAAAAGAILAAGLQRDFARRL